MSNSHSHKHDHSHTNLKGRNLFISIFLNIIITVAQVIGGLISGSLSLLSDALHNFTDVLSLIVSYVATVLSKKSASSHKTFGYKRAEILAAFVNAATLIIIAILLIKEAVIRFKHPQQIETGIVIWLSLSAIIGNGLSVLLLKAEAKKNMNMRSAYLHLFTDMLASVAVLFGGLLMKFYEFYWVDSVLTFVIAIYLIWVGFDLLNDSFKVLMLFSPKHIPVQDIVEEVQKIEDVKNVHHVHVWQLNEDEIHFEGHIDFNNDITLSQFDEVLIKIEELLYHKFKINHVTIQPEYGKCGHKDVIVQD